MIRSVRVYLGLNYLYLPVDAKILCVRCVDMNDYVSREPEYHLYYTSKSLNIKEYKVRLLTVGEETVGEFVGPVLNDEYHYAFVEET